MDNIDNLPIKQQYISTPFAYTKFSKNLSLLQQSVLVKVSEHLQSYIKQYFGSDLRKSRDIPRPLFSDADKNNGMPEFHVDYAELGVSINNNSLVHEKVKEVLALTVDAPGVDKDGNPAIIKYNIFTEGNMSSDSKNGVVFSLNPKVVDYVFDMSQGYVRHPADIARIGQVERMPMMYYYLFNKSEKWKNRVVHLTVYEIKNYFGMLERTVATADDKGRGRPTKGDVIKEAYPKFSQFRKNVLDTSIEDINRLKRSGLLDICVTYEPIYNGKRKVGNPAYIKFTIFDTIGEMDKTCHSVAQTDLFGDEIANQAEVQKELLPGEEQWMNFLKLYNGFMISKLREMHFRKFEKGVVYITASRGQKTSFARILTAHPDEKEVLRQKLNEAYGEDVKISY